MRALQDLIAGNIKGGVAVADEFIRQGKLHPIGVSSKSRLKSLAARQRGDVRFIPPDEVVKEMPDQSFSERNPFALRIKLSHRGIVHDVAIVPDLVFGLQLADGSRRSFMVKIDRGTMPVVRSDFNQTSFARKMRAYLTAHAARAHERNFGWKTFRILTITTDDYRMQSMKEALRALRVAHSPGASLFFFTTRAELCAGDPLALAWSDGNDKEAQLI